MKTPDFMCPGRLLVVAYMGAMQKLVHELMLIHPHSSEEELAGIAAWTLKEYGWS